MAGIVIASNISGLNANRNIKNKQAGWGKTAEKLSSGYRINRSADDAAGLVISEKMRSQVKGLNQARVNTEDGINMIKTMDGAMSGIHDMLRRQRQLMIQSLNDTYTDEDRDAIQKELDTLIAEIGKTADRTEFNTKNLLNIPNEEVPVPGASKPPLLNNIADKIIGKADVVFVIDISGSMGSSLAMVKETVKDFMADIPADSRTAVLLYSDLNIGEDMIKEDFTTDGDKIVNFVDSLTMYGGGDYEESGLEAIDEAVDMLAGSSAEKHIIFITDAESHAADTTGDSLLTAAGVNAKLLANNVVLHTIAPTALGQINELQSGTGGEQQSIGDVSSWFDESFILRSLDPIWIHTGANEDQGMYVDRYNCSPLALGIDYLAVKPREEAERSLGKIDKAINTVSGYRGNAGAQMNRLEHTVNYLGIAAENLEQANSRIRDADMAKEMLELTTYNILQQAGSAMLALARQQPEQVLQLLG